MKKFGIFALTVAVIAGLSACKGKVEEPDTAEFNWYLLSDYNANMLDLSKANANPSTIELSDELVFVAKGTDASAYVVWTGEVGHEYSMRELPDSLIKDTVNNVSKKAMGLALSSKDGLGRYYKNYTFSSISPVGNPFQMYGTARNYDYEKQDYSEIKAGPYSIEVIDTQTDLWNADDPYNSGGFQKYSLSFKIGSLISNTSTGAKGSYELIYEDVEKGIKPGACVTYPAGKDPAKASVIFKVNNCIPFVSDGTITYSVKFGTYTWNVDLSSPKTLVLASQSAVEEGYTSYLTNADEAYPKDKSKIVKSEYTKEYVFSAKEYK